ncbi:dihydrofolate reductase family protein [Saccharopolyspora sp. NPDC049357]|uniref:dihydrofolate reductase family protein n=1 Tax=Saccharopolyspora sp. NPDC049357 TaxID=3154507 RepID=UPI00341415F4
MAKLIYSAIGSLDGYLNDADGRYDWAVPSDEVFAFIIDRERDAGTYLYGRRMYEEMIAWETGDFTAEGPLMEDFAHLWRKAEKVVFSRTLAGVSTTRTRLMREFDPDAVRRLKESCAEDLLIGGAVLGGQALDAGLVDEVDIYTAPVLVGGGTRIFPSKARVPLNLVEHRSFDGGMTFHRYACAGHGQP